MEDCVFCKIIKGEISATKVLESDSCLAFLDIAPANKGHALVIPKEHHEAMADMPDLLIKELFTNAKKVVQMVRLATGASGYNLVMNNYSDAGQVVPHAHVHVIPRFKDDGQSFSWRKAHYKEGEIESVADKIRSFL